MYVISYASVGLPKCESKSYDAKFGFIELQTSQNGYNVCDIRELNFSSVTC